MPARYPGQQPGRWPPAVVAVLVVAAAVAAGLWAGRATANGATASPAGGPSCPGGRDDAGRRAAAVCLVQAYFALGRAPDRDSRLADLVAPGELDAARRAYQPLAAKVAGEYAAVAATRLTGSGAEITGQAWVGFVDSYTDGSAPLAQWWITSFALRWQQGRWWLAGGVTAKVDATPASTAAAPVTGFGPGWVAAGAP
jgi:hypothetical protein